MARICKCAKCASKIAAIYLSCEETRKVANSKELSVGILSAVGGLREQLQYHSTVEGSNSGGQTPGSTPAPAGAPRAQC